MSILFLSRSELEKITSSGFYPSGFGLSAKPDLSGLTPMGRFMADDGIGIAERLIHYSALVQPHTAEEWVGECSSKDTTSSVVAEVGSVCSLDTNRIARDFGGK